MRLVEYIFAIAGAAGLLGLFIAVGHFMIGGPDWLALIGLAGLCIWGVAAVVNWFWPITW